MPDLRETLAARFVNIFSPRITDALPWERLGRWQKDKWYELADECIRQMEWARSECVESVDSFDAGNSWLKNKRLTPAPDDWKPE